MSISFLQRLAETSTTKKQKRYCSPDFTDDDMSFSQPSPNAPSAPFCKNIHSAVVRSQDADSSDLEVSFASNVSLNSAPKEHLFLPSSSGFNSMDVSPAPVVKPNRPRAFTSGARLFGSDLSNARASHLPNPYFVVDSISKPTGTQSGLKGIQRSALPVEWVSTNRTQESPPSPPVQHMSSPSDDEMDVDTSCVAESFLFSPVPRFAAPTTSGLNPLFYDTLSPSSSPLGHPPKKRRSLSPQSTHALKYHDSSSPMLPSSPSEAKLERISNKVISSRSGKPNVSGLGVSPSESFLKRPRRRVLSTVIQPYENNINGTQSAHPILSLPGSGATNEGYSSTRGSAPFRRALSALLPPSICTEQSEEDSSFDGQDMSPTQAYAKRQQVKIMSQCNDIEDFRPPSRATVMVQKDSPSEKFMAAAGGFGATEAHGKILPCHRVMEDGLMRITCQTLDNLMDGKYSNEITDFRIIDCRFDYEYGGGHIRGAVNINTTIAVEDFLLGPCLTKPTLSVSGDTARKNILVFHCEFSVKRAPTFAKHLRARDRAMNNDSYPKVHYPEIYILEGGYRQYFKTSSHRCQPCGYVTMDDPRHLRSRKEDLDQFRLGKAKFGRHRSYAYGDGATASGKLMPFEWVQAQQQKAKRNTAPPSIASAPTAIAAADVDNLDTDEDIDIGDSPCPPQVKSTSLFKGRNGALRSEIHGPMRMNYR